MAPRSLIVGSVAVLAIAVAGRAASGQGGGFAYVANERSSNISAYSIDAAGTLTPIASSPVLAGSFPRSVATTPGAAPGPVVVAKK